MNTNFPDICSRRINQRFHKILFSPLAVKDIDGIKEYITAELGNSIAAENTIKKLFDDIEALENFPQMGMSLRKYTETATDIRYIVSEGYMCFYRASCDVIRIVRIIYSRRDYMRILFGQDYAISQ